MRENNHLEERIHFRTTKENAEKLRREVKRINVETGEPYFMANLIKDITDEYLEKVIHRENK